MWWVGLTGTWCWTRLVDQTGLKTLLTALLLWMLSAMSFTSSQLSTAWPTSGSKWRLTSHLFTHIFRLFLYHHYYPTIFNTVSSCGRGLRGWACPPVRKQTWNTVPSSDQMAQSCSSYSTGKTLFMC